MTDGRNNSYSKREPYSDQEKQELNIKFENALGDFIDKAKSDRNVEAIILAGSFAYDQVWEKSDLDMTILVREKTGSGFVRYEEDGITFNTSIRSLWDFKRALTRASGGDGLYSMFAKSKIVFTRDDSLYQFLDDTRVMGADDRAKVFFVYTSYLLGNMEKIQKWLLIKENPQYAQKYILDTASIISDMILLLENVPPDRESVLKAIKLRPDLIHPIYTRPLSGIMTVDEIYEVLNLIDTFLSDNMDMLIEVAKEALADGNIHTLSKLNSEAFNGSDVGSTMDYLAEKGVIERITQTVKITPKGRTCMEETAYMYFGVRF